MGAVVPRNRHCASPDVYRNIGADVNGNDHRTKTPAECPAKVEMDETKDRDTRLSLAGSRNRRGRRLSKQSADWHNVECPGAAAVDHIERRRLPVELRPGDSYDGDVETVVRY